MGSLLIIDGHSIRTHSNSIYIRLPVIYLWHPTFGAHMPTGNFLYPLVRLCESLGPGGSLAHMVIVVNVWDVKPDERQSKVTKVREFFKLALDKGAQFSLYDGTFVSAQTILRRVLRCWPDGGEGFAIAKPRQGSCEGAGVWICVFAAFPIILWVFCFMIYSR